ncbi:MAG: methyl-accepting chemotaxis protein [Candidatus Thiodiazotropha taylori]|nr:methyl-accepting chemotaxis protein [Candidatus Thiodiazotropha taylori]
MQDLINNLSIKTKLFSIALFLMSLMILSSGYALKVMDQVADELDAIVNIDIPMISIITKITENQLEQSRYFERFLRYASSQQQTTEGTQKIDINKAQFTQYDNKINQQISTAIALSQQGSQTAVSQIERTEMLSIEQSLNQIAIDHDSFKQHANTIIKLLTAGKTTEAGKLAESIENEEDQLTHQTESLLHEVELFTEEAGHRAAEHEHTALTILTILATLSLLIGIAISWLLSNNITKRISYSVEQLETIASGNLTSNLEVCGSDEIGKLQQAMSIMQQRLRDMIRHITDTTIQLSTAADEVATVTTQTNDNIQQQQSETEQITTAMTQMSATVREVSLNIETTSNSASDANLQVKNGQEMVTSALNGVNKLGEQIETNATVISELERNSENINSVLEVIKSIAEQTNLLALNAAIEAARAGEQGRGFAVVADEVRTLAGRTQDSTSEINQMIEILQGNSANAVKAMEVSRQQASCVVEQAQNADTALQAISASVSQIDQMSSQIATAAEEQSSVTDEMSRNIDHINNMAIQNASGTQQTSAAGDELSRMAASLQQMVSAFRI